MENIRNEIMQKPALLYIKFDEDTIEIRAKLNLIMDKGPFEITWDGWELMRTINTDINNAKY